MSEQAKKPFIIGCQWIWYAHTDVPDPCSRELMGLASERTRVFLKRGDLVHSIYSTASFYGVASRGADEEEKKTAREARQIRDRARAWLQANAPHWLANE